MCVDSHRTQDHCHKRQKQIPDNSESGGRLRLYRQIKTSPSVEQYILHGMSLNKRRVITQIRTGCLPLEIELGSYRSPKAPLANRICQLCNNGVGDETHLLLDCTLFSDTRKPLLDMMRSKINWFGDLSKFEKVCRILELSGSDNEVGKLVANLTISRTNQLK